jgi:hypothetical protein
MDMHLESREVGGNVPQAAQDMFAGLPVDFMQ